MAKEVVISNSRLNSRGYRILTEGIDLTQYTRNPVLLWQHNRPWRGTKDEVLPIGKMENLRVDGDNLIGTPVFDENDDFARQIKAKWEGGFLKMVSAGLEVIELSERAEHLVIGQTRATVSKSKLIEVSIVDIGANDDAIVLYSNGEILKLNMGKAIFKKYPDAKLVYFTSDGLAFFNLNAAENHERNLKGKGIETIENS